MREFCHTPRGQKRLRKNSKESEILQKNPAKFRKDRRRFGRIRKKEVRKNQREYEKPKEYEGAKRNQENSEKVKKNPIECERIGNNLKGSKRVRENPRESNEIPRKLERIPKNPK